MAILTVDFGMAHQPYTALVTLIDLLLYGVMSINVSRARCSLKVDAPSTEGPAQFQRIFRVHMNTCEQLVLHLPLLWLAAMVLSDRYAAACGMVWFIGRIVYAYTYYRAPKTRSPGYAIGVLANLVLFVGVLLSVMKSF